MGEAALFIASEAEACFKNGKYGSYEELFIGPIIPIPPILAVRFSFAAARHLDRIRIESACFWYEPFRLASCKKPRMQS
jgi:hypothetical protein